MIENPTAETDVTSTAVEIKRIMSTGTIWTAAGVIAPAVGLGLLLASGWRPADLPLLLAFGFWLGVIAAGVGEALLVWAGCPVLAFGLEDAYRQKVFCIRVGICMNVGGMAFIGLMLLLSPA